LDIGNWSSNFFRQSCRCWSKSWEWKHCSQRFQGSNWIPWEAEAKFWLL